MQHSGVLDLDLSENVASNDDVYVCIASVSENQLVSSVMSSSSEVGPHTVLSSQAAGSLRVGPHTMLAGNLEGVLTSKPPTMKSHTAMSDAAADNDSQSRSSTLTAGLGLLAGNLLPAHCQGTDR